MVNCEYLSSDLCNLASELAGKDVVTSPEACAVCVNHNKPKQLNNVTASLAIYSIGRPIPNDKKYLLNELKTVARTGTEGPGTELTKLISWFKFSSKKCKCKGRAHKMNEWGPDKCEQRMDTILRWLRHAAYVNKIPFNKSLVRIVVNKAIRNARNKQMAVHSNHSA